MANNDNLLKLEKGCPPREGAGRPKGSRNIKTMLRELLEVKDSEDNPDAADTDAMRPYSDQLIKKAFGANVPDAVQLGALKEIADRMEGKPTQYIEQKNEDINKKDLSKLTEKELKSMIKIEKKLDQE